MRKFVVTLSCIALVLSAVALTGCGGSKKSNNNSAAPVTAPQGAGTTSSSSSSSSSASSGGKASIGDNFFQPKEIKVKAGTKVTWTNDGQVQHTVTAENKSFDSGPVDAGSTFSYTFKKAGTFTYKCTIHAGQTGAVVVQ